MPDNDLAQEYDDELLDDADGTEDDSLADDDDEPLLDQDDAEGDLDDGDDSEEDDPEELLAAERARAEEAERLLAEQQRRETEREAERREADRKAAEKQRQDNRVRAWQTYQTKKDRIQRQRDQDWHDAQQSGDPAAYRAAAEMLRRSEERAVDAEYYTWVQNDHSYEKRELAQRAQDADIRDYADYLLETYRLPQAERARILKYADGTPVTPEAMKARAHELYEQRKEKATAKRKATTASREQGRQDVRGRNRTAPGGRSRGAAPPSGEFEGTIEELKRYFPSSRDTIRANRQR